MLSVDGAESVVAHLVHEAVEQRGRAGLVDAELTLLRVVVGLFDVPPALSVPADAHHPQELVDVCRCIHTGIVTVPYGYELQHNFWTLALIRLKTQIQREMQRDAPSDE